MSRYYLKNDDDSKQAQLWPEPARQGVKWSTYLTMIRDFQTKPIGAYMGDSEAFRRNHVDNIPCWGPTLKEALSDELD